MNEKANVALYVRVSTKGQDYQRQIADLTTYANRMGCNVLTTITEKMSGSVSLENRPEMQRLLAHAKSGTVQKVLVTEVSRLGRKTSDILQIVETLTDLKVSIVILNYNLETLLPTKKINPVATLLFTLLAEFSRLEKEVLKERIQSGLEHAKRRGITLGRPKGSRQSSEAMKHKYKGVLADLNSGLSIRKISKLRGVSINTIRKLKHPSSTP